MRMDLKVEQQQLLLKQIISKVKGTTLETIADALESSPEHL